MSRLSPAYTACAYHPHPTPDVVPVRLVQRRWQRTVSSKGSEPMTSHLPEHVAAASFVANPPRWTLRLQRTFAQDRTAVWRAITDPDALAQWTPIRPDRALTSPGPVRLTA